MKMAVMTHLDVKAVNQDFMETSVIRHVLLDVRIMFAKGLVKENVKLVLTDTKEKCAIKVRYILLVYFILFVSMCYIVCLKGPIPSLKKLR